MGNICSHPYTLGPEKWESTVLGAKYGSYLGNLSVFNERHEEFYYHAKEYNHFLKKISLVRNHGLARRDSSAVSIYHFMRHIARTSTTPRCLSY